MPTSVKLMDVIALFRDAILGHTPIATFCSTNYSKSLSLYVGYNSDDLPGEDNTPFAIIFPELKDSGWDVPIFEFSASIVIGIDDETYGDINNNGAKEWRGLYRIDEFAHLIEDALKSIDDSYNIQADIVNFDMIEMSYPLALTAMSVSARLPNVLGGGIMGIS